MKVITILAQKGGSGKTTTALNLAIAAEREGVSVCVLDQDPQGSATRWRDRRSAETPAVLPATAARLDKLIAFARKEGAQLVIIDTAPHSTGEALTAARAADFVLIPCRPDILDLEAISTSVDTAHMAKKRTKVLFNAVPPRFGLLDAARDAVSRYEVEPAPVIVTQRRIFSTALISGQTAQEIDPESKAAEEAAALWTWCKTMID